MGFGYKGIPKEFNENKLFDVFKFACHNQHENNGIYVRSFLSQETEINPEFLAPFLSRLQKLLIAQEQSIKETLELVQLKKRNRQEYNRRIKKMSDDQLSVAIHWCRKYNIPIKEN